MPCSRSQSARDSETDVQSRLNSVPVVSVEEGESRKLSAVLGVGTRLFRSKVSGECGGSVVAVDVACSHDDISKL